MENDIVIMLLSEAKELEDRGYSGWASTMLLAAGEIQNLKAAQQERVPDTATPCPKCGGELVSLIVCIMSDCDYKA